MPSQVLASLDQNALTADAFRLIQRNELTGLGDAALGIEAQTSGNFGGYAAGNHLQNLASEQHEEPIDKLLGHFLVTAAALGSKPGGFVHQVAVRRHLRRVIEKRRVGGGVLGTVPGDRLDVSRVRHNRGVSLQRFQ